MTQRNSDSGRLAVIWFATAIVLVLGAAGTAFVAIFAAENPQFSMMVWGGCFTTIVFVLILFNLRWEEPINQLKFWLSYQERSNPVDEYTAARRRIRSREKYGTNEPPSIESVRDAATDASTWVPRSATTARRPKKS